MSSFYNQNFALFSLSGGSQIKHMLCVLFVFLFTTLKCYAQVNTCSSVREAYKLKGFSQQDVPWSVIPGEHLRICAQGYTCCTQNMEHKLSTLSRQEFDKVMISKISLLRNTFISKTAKFDAFFVKLLESSKQDLHVMFDKAYGLLYQQNSHIFMQLFADLQSYYKGRDVSLADTLDTFFATLLQKLFQLVNPQYRFDSAYLHCVTEHMDQLRPFGDVPKKLAIQVRRSFIAARTFVQGMSIGRDVILSISKLQPTPSCSAAIVKMLYCPYCRGLADARPCNSYCMNVMKGCLPLQADINADWNNYVDALVKVADRLEGPFDIEAVVAPIDVKLSNAIMNFQENSATISQKVFTGCGQPKLGRQKREASADPAPKPAPAARQSQWGTHQNSPDSKKTASQPGQGGGGKSGGRGHAGFAGGYNSPAKSDESTTSLSRLAREIRKHVETVKNFWVNLPHAVCNQLATPVKETHSCWNGLNRDRYVPEIIRDGLAHQGNNPEVEVDVKQTNPMINQQLHQLKVITSRLKAAYNGLDVEWVDTAEVYSSGSGSGLPPLEQSGSGDRFQLRDSDLSFMQSTNRPPPVVKTHEPPYSGLSRVRSSSAGHITPLSSCVTLLLSLLACSSALVIWW